MTEPFEGMLDRALDAMGLPRRDRWDLPDSRRRFPDGAAFRIEIPSTEGPACLEAILEESARLDVPVHRVSQGSGVFMQTDRELDRMAMLGAEAGIEVSLFARPSAAWGPSAGSRSTAGAVLAPTAWGQDQVRFAMQDVLRAAAHGFRSVLIGDIGVLAMFDFMKRSGELPEDMLAKTSVMLPAANPAAARLLERLGAGTLNLPGDLTLAQVAGIREAVGVPIDFYVESPDSLGRFVRLPEVPELIRVAAPVYVKMGLSNAPDLYPSGAHLVDTAVAMSRERVRRARLVLELLERAGMSIETSRPGSAGLRVPIAAGAPAPAAAGQRRAGSSPPGAHPLKPELGSDWDPGRGEPAHRRRSGRPRTGSPG